jgi:hypothetical protein
MKVTFTQLPRGEGYTVFKSRRFAGVIRREGDRYDLYLGNDETNLELVEPQIPLIEKAKSRAQWHLIAAEIDNDGQIALGQVVQKTWNGANRKNGQEPRFDADWDLMSDEDRDRCKAFGVGAAVCMVQIGLAVAANMARKSGQVDEGELIDRYKLGRAVYDAHLRENRRKGLRMTLPSWDDLPEDEQELYIDLGVTVAEVVVEGDLV